MLCETVGMHACARVRRLAWVVRMSMGRVGSKQRTESSFSASLVATMSP